MLSPEELFAQAEQQLAERRRAKRANGHAFGDNGHGANASPEAAGASGQTKNHGVLSSKRASQIAMRAITWLWPNRFALGKLAIIGGLPDRGKGLTTADIIARVTKGTPWPCGEGAAQHGSVLLMSAEDDPADTIVPRLAAAGADLDRVEIIGMTKTTAGERMFNLKEDIAALSSKIDEIGDVKLIVIDPMSAYLGVGKMDSYKTTDVRGVLAPLCNLAAQKGVCIIAVAHFNKQADVHNAMLRISDSLAYVATARHCYCCIDDDENERRLFVKAKNNLAPDTKALSYTVKVEYVGDDPNTMAPIFAPRIVWGDTHVDTSTEAALEGESGGKRKRPTEAKDTASEFLREKLRMGPMPQADIEEEAKAEMISLRTLQRVKKAMGVKSRKDGPGGKWLWEIPAQPAPAARDA